MGNTKRQLSGSQNWTRAHWEWRRRRGGFDAEAIALHRCLQFLEKLSGSLMGDGEWDALADEERAGQIKMHNTAANRVKWMLEVSSRAVHRNAVRFRKVIQGLA